MLAGKSLKACLYVAHSAFLVLLNGESGNCVQSHILSLRVLSILKLANFSSSVKGELAVTLSISAFLASN